MRFCLATFYFFISSFCISALFAAQGHTQHTDPLRALEIEVERSKKFKSPPSKQLYTGKWLTPGSNFAKIFVSEDSPRELFSWVDFSDPSFVPGALDSKREREYVFALRPFRDLDVREYKVTILVPHPRYMSMREMGLIQHFQQFDPSSFITIAREKFSFKDDRFRGELYQRDNGACGITVLLTQGAMLHIGFEHIALKDKAKQLLQLFDLERLEAKLNS